VRRFGLLLAPPSNRREASEITGAKGFAGENVAGESDARGSAGLLTFAGESDAGVLTAAGESAEAGGLTAAGVLSEAGEFEAGVDGGGGTSGGCAP
jgi:hypothetical protein